MPIAGPSIQKNRLTSGVQRGRVNRSSSPRRRASAIAIASWVAPDARKPQLAMLATPGELFGNQAAKARKPIMQTFAAAGAEAGTLHELLALSVPWCRANTAMKAM